MCDAHECEHEDEDDERGDFVDTIPLDWASSNWHCVQCGSSWTGNEVVEDGELEADGDWWCPNCGGFNFG